MFFIAFIVVFGDDNLFFIPSKLEIKHNSLCFRFFYFTLFFFFTLHTKCLDVTGKKKWIYCSSVEFYTLKVDHTASLPSSFHLEEERGSYASDASLLVLALTPSFHSR